MLIVFITGSNGTLGSELVKSFKNEDGVKVYPLTREDFDLTNSDTIRTYFKNYLEYSHLELQDPDNKLCLINCAAMIGLNNCKQDWKKAYETNVTGIMNIIKSFPAWYMSFYQISTDYVYDGNWHPYHMEEEALHPTSWYAFTKLMGEAMALKYSNMFVLRTSFFPKNIDDWMFGYDNKWTSGDYVDVIADLIKRFIIKCNGKYNKIPLHNIYNIGTERKTFYDLALQRNPNVKPCKAPEGTPLDTSMCINRYKSFLGVEYV